MDIVDVEQGSDEWKAERCGKVTASRIADMMAKTKSGWGASRSNYRAELVIERLTKSPAEKFTNAAMAWGTEKEPEARLIYELMHDVEVRQVGMIRHATIAYTLASPDGLVGSEGMIEIKCPQSNTHIDTLLSGTVPSKYLYQIAWQMACAGPQIEWTDFVSFDPRMPANMQMFVARVDRDNALIAELEREVPLFLAEVQDTVDKLVRRYGATLEAAA